MARKKQQRSIEELVRRHGVPPRPTVEPLVSEVRSDDVPVLPSPPPTTPEGALGGVVVIWEFCLSHGDVQEFHDYLRQNESFIGAGVTKAVEGAGYRGTYMVLAGTDPCCRHAASDVCYRVIWSYTSLDVMTEAWSATLKNKKAPLYKMVTQLRAFWLRDPERSEVRTAPARFFYDPRQDVGDAFAKLTLEAAKLNASSSQSSARRSSHRD